MASDTNEKDSLELILAFLGRNSSDAQELQAGLNEQAMRLVPVTYMDDKDMDLDTLAAMAIDKAAECESRELDNRVSLVSSVNADTAALVHKSIVSPLQGRGLYFVLVDETGVGQEGLLAPFAPAMSRNELALVDGFREIGGKLHEAERLTAASFEDYTHSAFIYTPDEGFTAQLTGLMHKPSTQMVGEVNVEYTLFPGHKVVLSGAHFDDACADPAFRIGFNALLSASDGLGTKVDRAIMWMKPPEGEGSFGKLAHLDRIVELFSGMGTQLTVVADRSDYEDALSRIPKEMAAGVVFEEDPAKLLKQYRMEAVKTYVKAGKQGLFLPLALAGNLDDKLVNDMLRVGRSQLTEGEYEGSKALAVRGPAEIHSVDNGGPEKPQSAEVLDVKPSDDKPGDGQKYAQPNIPPAEGRPLDGIEDAVVARLEELDSDDLEEIEDDSQLGVPAAGRERTPTPPPMPAVGAPEGTIRTDAKDTSQRAHDPTAYRIEPTRNRRPDEADSVKTTQEEAGIHTLPKPPAGDDATVAATPSAKEGKPKVPPGAADFAESEVTGLFVGEGRGVRGPLDPRVHTDATIPRMTQVPDDAVPTGQFRVKKPSEDTKVGVAPLRDDDATTAMPGKKSDSSVTPPPTPSPDVPKTVKAPVQPAAQPPAATAAGKTDTPKPGPLDAGAAPADGKSPVPEKPEKVFNIESIVREDFPHLQLQDRMKSNYAALLKKFPGAEAELRDYAKRTVSNMSVERLSDYFNTLGQLGGDGGKLPNIIETGHIMRDPLQKIMAARKDNVYKSLVNASAAAIPEYNVGGESLMKNGLEFVMSQGGIMEDYAAMFLEGAAGVRVGTAGRTAERLFELAETRISDDNPEVKELFVTSIEMYTEKNGWENVLQFAEDLHDKYELVTHDDINNYKSVKGFFGYDPDGKPNDDQHKIRKFVAGSMLRVNNDEVSEFFSVSRRTVAKGTGDNLDVGKTCRFIYRIPNWMRGEAGFAYEKIRPLVIVAAEQCQHGGKEIIDTAVPVVAKQDKEHHGRMLDILVKTTAVDVGLAMHVNGAVAGVLSDADNPVDKKTYLDGIMVGCTHHEDKWASALQTEYDVFSMLCLARAGGLDISNYRRLLSQFKGAEMKDVWDSVDEGTKAITGYASLYGKIVNSPDMDQDAKDSKLVQLRGVMKRLAVEGFDKEKTLEAFNSAGKEQLRKYVELVDLLGAEGADKLPKDVLVSMMRSDLPAFVTADNYADTENLVKLSLKNYSKGGDQVFSNIETYVNNLYSEKARLFIAKAFTGFADRAFEMGSVEGDDNQGALAVAAMENVCEVAKKLNADGDTNALFFEDIANETEGKPFSLADILSKANKVYEWRSVVDAVADGPYKKLETKCGSLGRDKRKAAFFNGLKSMGSDADKTRYLAMVTLIADEDTPTILSNDLATLLDKELPAVVLKERDAYDDVQGLVESSIKSYSNGGQELLNSVSEIAGSYDGKFRKETLQVLQGLSGYRMISSADSARKVVGMAVELNKDENRKKYFEDLVEKCSAPADGSGWNHMAAERTAREILDRYKAEEEKDALAAAEAKEADKEGVSGDKMADDGKKDGDSGIYTTDAEKDFKKRADSDDKYATEMLEDKPPRSKKRVAFAVLGIAALAGIGYLAYDSLKDGKTGGIESKVTSAVPKPDAKKESVDQKVAAALKPDSGVYEDSTPGTVASLEPDSGVVYKDSSPAAVAAKPKPDSGPKKAYAGTKPEAEKTAEKKPSDAYKGAAPKPEKKAEKAEKVETPVGKKPAERKVAKRVTRRKRARVARRGRSGRAYTPRTGGPYHRDGMYHIDGMSYRVIQGRTPHDSDMPYGGDRINPNFQPKRMMYRQPSTQYQGPAPKRRVQPNSARGYRGPGIN